MRASKLRLTPFQRENSPLAAPAISLLPSGAHYGGRKDTHTLAEILTDAGLYNGMNGSPVPKNRQDYQLLHYATRVRLTAETRDG